MCDKCNTKLFVGLLVLAVLGTCAILIAFSLKSLNTYEVGLKYDSVWRKLSNKAQGVGLYSGPPGFYFITFNSVFTNIAFNDLKCLNKDGVTITLKVSFQYRPRQQHLHQIVALFRDKEAHEAVLTSSAKSAIMEACSQYNTSQFQSERGKFQETVGLALAKRSDPLFCDVSDIQIRNIARPDAYENAIQEKETSKENIKVLENRRPRLITEAETDRRRAETQANITIARARSQGRIILTRANATASAILKEYETEALTYETLMSSDEGLGLSNEAFVSYMGIRTISNAKNPVYIGMKSPAKTSYNKP